MESSLRVSECFKSLQGESQTMGHPAYFLRISRCNLFCGLSKETFKKAYAGDWDQDKINKNKRNDATWVCDSISVFMKGTKKSFKQITEDFGGEEFIDDLKQGVHLIITGGEPMLQQERVLNYIFYLGDNYQVFPIVEIETNGTIMPKQELGELVRYWNVSPKLSNSGMRHHNRVDEVALSWFNANERSIFKFVISSKEDWLEVINEFLNPPIEIDPHKIWLMPSASSRKELLKNNKIVAELCIKNNLRFSSRLQAEIWDQLTGV